MTKDKKTTSGKTARKSTSRDEKQLSFWETAAPNPPPPRTRSKSSASKLFAKIDPELSTTVGNEIMAGKLKPATWALALAYSDGSHDQAITHYARLRLESLADASDFTKSKEQALEARRKLNFRKVPNPPQRPYSGNLPAPRTQNRRRIRLSPVWLSGLWLAATAASVAGSRHFVESNGSTGDPIGLLGSFGIGAILVGAISILHLSLPRVRFALRLLVPLGAWSGACASFYFGLMILENKSDSAPPVATNSRATEKIQVREILENEGAPQTRVVPQKELPSALVRTGR